MTGLLGKYRLDARLGGGGMAEVFLASTVGAEGFSRKVAIKRVLPGFSDNPAFSKMFIDEARISSRLVHPNIVSVVDFDRDPEGRLYLVMELVEGRDLDGLAGTGPLPVPVIIFVISEVLRGLGHAHDLPVVDDQLMQGSNTIRSMRGIVHRDVSPHNVLLGWEGAVKVSDFGIAKARSASSATASEFIKGKPAYMSPEQANGESLDGRSDLFAVGVMMWELLVGRRLFVGQDTRATLAAVLFGQIPRPRSLRTEVPKDVEKVVMKLLERDINARYKTAEAAVQELLACSAAPRDGREVLKTALSERFPQHAPVRHSVLRSRGGSPVQPQPHNSPPQGYPQQGHPQPQQPQQPQQGYPQQGHPQQGHPQQGYPQQPGYPQGPQPAAATQQGYGAPRQELPPHLQPTQPAPAGMATIADGNIGRPLPHGALPSLGEVRGANTATMQPMQQYAGAAATPRMPDAYVGPAAQPIPRGRGGGGKVAILIGSLIAAGAVVFAIVMATRGGAKAKTDLVAQGSGSQVTGSVAGSGSSTAGAMTALVPPDAAPALAPIDAAVADAPATPPDADVGEIKKDATVARPGEKRMGRLVVKAFPILTVYVDNKKIRDTPINMPLSVGKHKLRLVNSEGKDENIPVTIEENKTTSIDRN